MYEINKIAAESSTELKSNMKHINDRKPNVYYGKKFYLLRCFSCDPSGKENYAMAVASGTCAWCGWNHTEKGDEST